MWRPVLKRLLLCPVILWAIYTITFLMVITIPGNPFKQGERNMSPEVARAVRALYQADDNWVFYWQYLGRLINPVQAWQGTGPLIDLGPSWQYRDWTCNEIIAAALPVSVGLGLMAIFIATVVGTAVGVVSAVKRDSWFDYT